MEDRLNTIKDSLNQTVLRDVTVSQDEKNRIMNSLHHKQRRRIPYAYYFSVVAVAAILFILMLPHVSEYKDPASATIEKQMKEEYGHQVYFPSFEQYPITYVSINYPPLSGKVVDTTVVYSVEKGELFEGIRDNENQKILYGPYDGHVLFRITFNNFLAGSTLYQREKISNGISVFYEKNEHKKGKFMFASFNVDNGSYHIEFNLTEDFNEKDAFDIVDTLTGEIGGD
ncbi:hypothetical protein LCL95_10035 [Bacillus timonensis]|nr:hypothetical protein [Bacillus timonensis]